MKPPRETWPFSSILLILFGASLLVVGVYFLALRPPLLPEDLRYVGASQAQLEAVAPQLASWLTQVFRVLGGYVSATGILTIALAATSYRSHHCGAGAANASAGLISIGLMAGVNFAIDSDFKWELLTLAILWACSMFAFFAEKLRFENGRQNLERSAVATLSSGPKNESSAEKPFERQYADSATLTASAPDVFACADDFTQLSSHMSRSSAMMVGGYMRTSFDSAHGRAIGSHVRMEGKLLGVELSLEEVVTERIPPLHKAWQTVGTPRLLVLGNYRLGFTIVSRSPYSSDLSVFIQYNLPPSPPLRWLGHLLGATYAKWCVQQMIDSARSRFPSPD
jgi:hypothetical protein